MEQALPELAVFRELHEDEHDGDGGEDDDEDEHHDDDDDDNGLSQSSSLSYCLCCCLSFSCLCPRPMTVSLFWPLLMIPDVRVKRNWQQHPRLIAGRLQLFSCQAPLRELSASASASAPARKCTPLYRFVKHLSSSFPRKSTKWAHRASPNDDDDVVYFWANDALWLGSTSRSIRTAAASA